MKEANEMYQRKIDAIYSNNIIIAKERKDDDPAKEEKASEGFVHI